MLSQISEQDSHTEKPTLETQTNFSSPQPAPEKPKGSAARKWIVLLVILAAVGAAVWKIRSNAKEQDSHATDHGGAGGSSDAGAGVCGAAEDDADLS